MSLSDMAIVCIVPYSGLLYVVALSMCFRILRNSHILHTYVLTPPDELAVLIIYMLLWSEYNYRHALELYPSVIN